MGYETGDVLTLGIAGSNSNVTITISDAEAYDGNIGNGGGQKAKRHYCDQLWLIQ